MTIYAMLLTAIIAILIGWIIGLICGIALTSLGITSLLEKHTVAFKNIDGNWYTGKNNSISLIVTEGE
jgi:ABC-type uncharacterized transport system permease subunit